MERLFFLCTKKDEARLGYFNLIKIKYTKNGAIVEYECIIKELTFAIQHNHSYY